MKQEFLTTLMGDGASPVVSRHRRGDGNRRYDHRTLTLALNGSKPRKTGSRLVCALPGRQSAASSNASGLQAYFPQGSAARTVRTIRRVALAFRNCLIDCQL